MKTFSLEATSISATLRTTAEDIAAADRPKPQPETRKSESGMRGRVTVEEAMQRTGTNSPSEALKELKKQNGRYGYIPHVGAKQRMKAQRAAEKAAAKAAKKARDEAGR